MGLAHRRLSIIDLTDAAAQPMLDPDTGSVIVFNGEIYNYRELRAELEAQGVMFRTASDTEVLLRLYGKYGEAMIERLRGMFAFAIWDALRQRLFLARDPFGVKPLYIADDGQVLRFASQVKALLAGGSIDTAPSPAGHVGFFLWGHVPEPFTLYKSIRALPAGTCFFIDCHGRREERRFFDLNAELRKEESSTISSEDGGRILRDALADTVRAHLVADVPVGVFLSAGLDSTTIAALAAEEKGTRLRTFTLGFREFKGTLHDEAPLAEEVAKRYGTSHKTSWVHREDFVVGLDHLLAAMDQPSIDGVNSYFVAKAAHEAGLKVALSGLGGDELFAGYSDFRDIPRLVNALRPFEWLPGLGKAFRYVAAPLIQRVTSPKYAGLFEYGGEWGGAYLLRRGLFMPWELPAHLDTDLVREGWNDLQTRHILRQTIVGVGDDRLKVTALETAWYLRNQLLRDTDWASMAHSLEVRVPFVDAHLFRAVVRLIHGGFVPTKREMASAPALPLPGFVLNRPKTGFSLPVREWLLDERGELGRRSADVRGLRLWALRVHERFSSATRAA
jgi:asparagine synthase (glutamine-hydrolysing)